MAGDWRGSKSASSRPRSQNGHRLSTTSDRRGNRQKGKERKCGQNPQKHQHEPRNGNQRQGDGKCDYRCEDDLLNPAGTRSLVGKVPGAADISGSSHIISAR